MSKYAEPESQVVAPLHLQPAEPAKNHPTCNKMDTNGDREDADEFSGVNYPEEDDKPAANAHESMKSLVVEDTQFVGIEVDSQARESGVDRPLPSPIPPPASRPAKTAAQEIEPNSGLISAPVIASLSDIGSGFTFGAPPARKPINIGPPTPSFDVERRMVSSSSDGRLAMVLPSSTRKLFLSRWSLWLFIRTGEPKHRHTNNTTPQRHPVAPSHVRPDVPTGSDKTSGLQQDILSRHNVPNEEPSLAIVAPRSEMQKQQIARLPHISINEEQTTVQMYLHAQAIQVNNATPKSGRKDSSK